MRKYVSRLKLFLQSSKAHIINTTRLPSPRYIVRTLLNSDRGEDYFPVKKPSRESLHSILHRVAERWPASLFSYVRSATPYARSRIQMSERGKTRPWLSMFAPATAGKGARST